VTVMPVEEPLVLPTPASGAGNPPKVACDAAFDSHEKLLSAQLVTGAPLPPEVQPGMNATMERIHDVRSKLYRMPKVIGHQGS